MELGLKGRAVLVTGGNRGIGLAIALGFADEGAHVAICGRDEAALETARAAIAGRGVPAAAIVADLFTPDGCERAVAETVKALGRLDVLVNNASTSVSGRLETLSDDKVMERVMGKTLASMRCARAALPHLRESGRGRIVCIGGSSARVPESEGSLPGGLGNSSLSNFVKHFSNDVAPDGITVNVIHPPFTKTERYPDRVAALARARGVSLEEAEQLFADRYPIGRVVEPDDIAPMVLFLASEQAGAVTGQAIGVDGGATPNVIY